jgi:hypothetical protein
MKTAQEYLKKINLQIEDYKEGIKEGIKNGLYHTMSDDRTLKELEDKRVLIEMLSNIETKANRAESEAKRANERLDRDG